MDLTFTENLALLGAALMIGAAAFWAYLLASPGLPKSQRPRVFVVVMTIPVVLMAIIPTSNPLPLFLLLLPASRRGGPSG